MSVVFVYMCAFLFLVSMQKLCVIVVAVERLKNHHSRSFGVQNDGDLLLF